MSKADTERDRIERLMRQTRLPGPSETLKTQITATALDVWNRNETGIPVPIVLRRMVASAAAAVILVALAEGYSNHTVSPWQSGTVTATYRAPLDLEGLLESPRPVFVQHMRLQSRSSSTMDAGVLWEHLERVREILDEGRERNDAETVTPVGGRSRLMPIRPSFGATS